MSYRDWWRMTTTLLADQNKACSWGKYIFLFQEKVEQSHWILHRQTRNFFVLLNWLNPKDTSVSCQLSRSILQRLGYLMIHHKHVKWYHRNRGKKKLRRWDRFKKKKKCRISWSKFQLLVSGSRQPQLPQSRSGDRL